MVGRSGRLAWLACGDDEVRRSPIDAAAGALGLPAPQGRGPDARARRLAAALAEAGENETVVVVDDAHLLGERATRELVALAGRLPGTARVAVASRWALPPALAAARPDAVTLDAATLAVGPAECRDLLAALGVAASDEEARAQSHDAEGCIAAIVLAARPGGDPLAYLLAEVVDPLPGDVARLLEEIRVLDRFTPDLAAEVSGRADAAQLLEVAEARGALLVPAAEGPPWRRQHRMLRAALERRGAGRPVADTAALHRRAAVAWTALGEPDAAARHHLAAGDLEAAVTALAALGRVDGPAGGPQVQDLLRAVPPVAWSDAPGEVLAQASALFYRADHVGAFEAMETAARELLAAGDAGRAAAVLVRLLRAAPLAGGLYDRTVAAADAMVPRLGDDPVLVPAALTMVALLTGEAGRYEDAESRLATALEAGRGDPLCAARVAATRAFAIDFPQGRARQAISTLDQAIPALEGAADRDVLNYELYAIAFRSMILADVGRFDRALDDAERFAEAAARRGLARLAGPVVAMLRLVPLAGLGHLDRLGTEVARNAPAFMRLGGALRSYRHDVAVAQLAAQAGDPERVTAAVGAARMRLAEHGLPYDGAMALVDLSATARAAGQHELSRELSDEARALAERAAAPWALARAAMARAAAWGPGEEGDRALAEALRRSSEPRLEALWARRERALAAELLPRALERGVGPEDVAVRLARACGGEVLTACAHAADRAPERLRLALAETAGDAVAADGALAHLLGDPEASVRAAAHRAREARLRTGAQPVHLVTLGRFAVERGGQPVPEREFGRQKARTLLTVLACGRGGVHREELVGILWPELPAKRGLAALHTTLHALRRVLEPHLSSKEPSSVIVAEGSSYRLVLGRRASWDADVFLRAAHEGLSARDPSLPALERAERLYTGAFLPEWTFAPWSRGLRTELEEAHRTVVARTAGLMSERGDHAGAIARYRLLLAMEPERESWHRGLMEAYVAGGERALALRQFHACRTLLREGLGVEPSRETRELHVRILRDD